MSWTGLWLKLTIQMIGRYYVDEIQFNNMNEIMFMDAHDQHPCN
jgi:hypothetical protein